MLFMKKLLFIMFVIATHSCYIHAQSNSQELAYTQQVYDSYLWKAEKLYSDCCYEECIEALEFCSRMNSKRFIYHPSSFQKMQFIPSRENENHIKQFIQKCKDKRIGSFTCIGKKRMYLYATYNIDGSLNNISFRTPWGTNVKISKQNLSDAIKSAKIAKKEFSSKKNSLGDFHSHKGYKEELSENQAYYRGLNWNSWDNQLRTMKFYFWINMNEDPIIEVDITTNTNESLVFYLNDSEIGKYINCLEGHSL